MEISVVVPIYNLSDELDRLVAIFRNQTFTDFDPDYSSRQTKTR